MNAIKQIIKIIIFFILVVTFFLASLLVDLIIWDRRRKLISFSKIASFYGKMSLIVIGAKLKHKNTDRYIGSGHNYMIVSNHLSYIDIFIIYSYLPAVFIANTELEEEFPLGVVTRYAGGVFVERRNRSRLLDDMDNISSVLKMGLNVVLFPESTTSNGEGVLPFKAPFLKSAINTSTKVLPICIKYKSVNGEEINNENRDLVYYYGGAKFFEHFFRLLKTDRVEVELEALEEIEVTPEMTRKELSNLTYDQITGAYHN